MNRCWECEQPRDLTYGPCKTCGAPAYRTYDTRFVCSKCRKPKTGTRIIEKGEMTCAPCFFGDEPELADTPREKIRWPTALWRWA